MRSPACGPRTFAVTTLLTVLTAILVPAGWSRPAAADDGCGGCTVSPGPGSYVGSLLIPPGSRPDPPGLRSAAASCDGCVWTLEPACQRPGATGGVVCPAALQACPPPALRLALLLRRPGEAVSTRVGTFCDDPGVPLQPTALLPGVRDRFVQLLPRLRPTFEPAGFGIVNVPVVFAAGQAGSIGRPVFDLAGHSVQLTAAATWRWEFGDGAELTSSSPGGSWPDLSVAHSYRAGGRFPAAVTTAWAGQFWVDGVGPFVVDGAPVTQSVPLVVPVRTARAELVAGPG